MAPRLLAARGLAPARQAALASVQRQCFTRLYSSSNAPWAERASGNQDRSRGYPDRSRDNQNRNRGYQDRNRGDRKPAFNSYKPKTNYYKSARENINSEQTVAQMSVKAMWEIQEENIADRMVFHKRHIGPRDQDVTEMLKTVGLEGKGLDDFVKEVVPEAVLSPLENSIVKSQKATEENLYSYFTKVASKNAKMTWMNGQGYFPVHVPAVIKRNILENPAWYTSYTPYQAEISQGRLQSLLNFQTMVSDLTGLPVANASLLDEGTAAAEAMTMSLNCLPASRVKKATNKTYVVSNNVNFSTRAVMTGRAEGFGINILKLDLEKPESLEKIKELGDDLVGVMVQYPDTKGQVFDYRGLADLVHAQGALLSAATDLSALTVLTPPGEWGADIAFGNSQRFGVPLGNGGPHAAFFAVKDENKRRLPGRLVGMTKDRLGNPALRLALQTREQHIRREKATSNVCTAQALLANIAAMYAIYHGPQQLQTMALENIRSARMIAEAGQYYGFDLVSSPDGVLSDTVAFACKGVDPNEISAAFEQQHISIAQHGSYFTLSSSNNVEPGLFVRIVRAFSLVSSNTEKFKDEYAVKAQEIFTNAFKKSNGDILASLPEQFRRQSAYLTHPVFNSYHSETEMLRYMYHLQSKDLSQVHSMIPLGSCTMKLNGTSQMELITFDAHANVHPLARPELVAGHSHIVNALNGQLAALTGMNYTCIQPNSGAQGEFAGLRVIRKYLSEQPGGENRDVCLIPVSAHGTNPASAAMAGMRTVPIKCDTATGNLDLADLEAKCIKHAHELAAIMITYPSTYGVFEPYVKQVCDMVHKHGGLVYMDGANMNAQIGLMSPGQLGADVCHLNLHKTFCIPHGGGGPGVGPICMVEKLRTYAPGGPNSIGPVSSARLGSSSILPISWAYITLMRDDGLKRATQVALLNANYLLARLKDHYPILYTNENGRCAHEFIIDARPFQKSAGIEVSDIAKRLQDYGFHAPTMSWPVPNTLMVEPTESESKEELDRFADALISIRQEIRDIEEGRQPRTGNVLKNAPHPFKDIVKGDNGGWERSYTREVAAYPLPYLAEKKFWPTVARADDTYGDTNLFCTCPPVEDTTNVD